MLSLDEYARYSRQLLLPPPAFGGVDAQLALKRAHVLVVGGGGLGCPAVTYLAAAGVGHITVVDPDVVERSNLARQFLHTDAGAENAQSKAHSIADAVHRINPHVEVIPVVDALTAANALRLVSAADIVLDCTDNPLTRYLISDAAVLAGKTVVSGAAQGVEGQLVVLNKALDKQPHTTNRGPCYRCLFPKAPRPEEVQNCSDGGVLGVVTGLVGTLQALETIKLLAGLGEARITSLDEEDYLAFCGLNRPPTSGRPVAQIEVTSFAEANRTSQSSIEGNTAPRQSEAPSPNTIVLPIRAAQSIVENESAGSSSTSTDVAKTQPKHPPLIIDVRPPHEFRIAHLAGTTNIPLAKIRRTVLKARKERAQQQQQQQQQSSATTTHLVSSNGVASVLAELGLIASATTGQDVHVLCRRGNDSREAVLLLSEHLAASSSPNDKVAPDRLTDADGEGNDSAHSSPPGPPDIDFRFFNVTGGLHAYAKHMDPKFPVY
ncbi:hypothetical protein OC834_003815 [Tilletia horrida]|nr:hypothetical protein OC834_003815 [Tilletia horrida]